MSAPVAAIFAQATNAAPAADPNAAGGGLGGMLFPFVLIALMVYFGIFRPQSQARKKQEALLKGAKTGDKVVTTGGIHGVISNVKETTFILKVSDNSKIEIEKSHIDRVLKTDEAVVTEVIPPAKG